MRAGWWLFASALVAGYLLALGLTVASVVGGNPSGNDEHWCAGLAAIGVLVLFTVALRLLRIRVGGLVIGQDRRLSTSKLQALLWTYALLGVLLAIVIANWIGASAGFDSLVDQGLPEEYLILLGGPFAAAIASKALVSSKVESGTLTKTEGAARADPGRRAGEAFGDDQGNTDLVDTQYLLFNFLGLLYVLGGFVADPSGGVPSIPGLLVGLTSVSAATYVSRKAIQSNVPVLSAVVPAEGAPGDPVRLIGRNLLIPHHDGAYHEVFVLFDKRAAQVIGLRKEEEHLAPDDGDTEHLPRHEASGDDEVWVEVPHGLSVGTVRVTVRNFKGVATTDRVEFEVTS